jgi:ArsR family transcriptional regulator, arsenate/arsenite/antimonite-responsive transcriptional repressor / arsenate reductase (thioredoxin)
VPAPRSPGSPPSAPHTTLQQRAQLHAALAEPARLAIVDELVTSDRSPSELGERLGLRSNLLARHLDVLESVGLITRWSSARDGRRKYVHLVAEQLATVEPRRADTPHEVLFVCTQNTARSPLAAALWRRCTRGAASSAGLRPAPQLHRGTLAVAKRLGVALEPSAPRLLDASRHVAPGVQVITVCDSVHEEIRPPASWWHWSIPDPVEIGSAQAFDIAAAQLLDRMTFFSPLVETGDTPT